jgi:hypothetical protein
MLCATTRAKVCRCGVLAIRDFILGTEIFFFFRFVDPHCADSVPAYEWHPADHNIYMGVPVCSPAPLSFDAQGVFLLKFLRFRTTTAGSDASKCDFGFECQKKLQ